MDRTVIIGAAEKTGKGETGITMIGAEVIGTLVGTIIVIIIGMEVDGVIHTATGTATSTTLVKEESIVIRVSGITATVLRTSQEGIQPGDSVTTRLAVLQLD